MTKLRPTEDRLVVQPLESEEKSAGGIYLPETAKEKPTQGKVIAVGPGKMLKNGTRQEPAVKVGETVLFSKYAGTDVKIDGVEYKIIQENEVLAVVE